LKRNKESNDSGLLPPETAASDEFRAVIDDLTVENKRLKKRLRRYQRSNRSSQLQPEALFELRLHGLPAERKRDLEKLLQDFVAKLGNSPRHTNLTSTTGTGAGTGSRVPLRLLPEKQSSSQSLSRIGDSGYRTMSLTGQNSSNMSGSGALKRAEPTKGSREKGIHDYLSDIPTGLLPHRTGPLTDREKRKNVVRKIEQIFAGRDSAAGGHHHPIQQQHVAQSAARADRRANEAAGTSTGPEGSREARIMDKLDLESTEKKDASNNDSAPESNQDSNMEEDGLFEQRPTRPLDLDPFRAQVPAENMQYLRHLGFSPPRPEQSMNPQPDGHGWIHLNILTNMAQTHFEHVTMDFVRKAITESSKMLELSSDGRKVRWMGGNKYTNSSSNSPDDDNTRSMSSDRPSVESGSALQKLSSSRHKLNYSPLFQQREDSDMDDDDSAYQQSGAVASSDFATSSKQKSPRHKDDAPIIFYQNPHFYTDMSKDVIEKNSRQAISYTGPTADPVGASLAAARNNLYYKLEFEKGPLSQPNPLQSDKPSPPGKGFQTQNQTETLVVRSGQTSSISPHTSPDLYFEASGIGGVLPADNFAISVHSKQAADHVAQQTTGSTVRRENYTPIIRSALRGGQSVGSTQTSSPTSSVAGKMHVLVHREIIGSKRRELPASELPEAVFLHDSSDDEDEDDDEDMDYESGMDDNSSSKIPQSAPQKMDWAPSPDMIESQVRRQGRLLPDTSPEDSDEDSDEEDDEPDESVDLLTTTRKVDPVTVRAQEREFDSNITERLTNDIPPGSSAATAEGGSGFNSPADAAATAGAPNLMIFSQARATTTSDMQRARRGGTPTLKRVRRSDDAGREGRNKSPRTGGS
jgi:hypothetical protein